MRALGAALVLLGLLALFFGGIPYDRRQTIAEIGGLKMQATEKRELTVPPVVAGLAILVGAGLFFRGGRRPPA